LENKRIKLTEYQDAMDIKDLCEFLGISRVTAYRFIEKHHIKHLKVGREYRVSRTALAEYLGIDLREE